jgi:hypothetical protein
MIMHNTGRLICLLTMILSLTIPLRASRQKQQRGGFPMQKGYCWVYRGGATWVEIGSSAVRETTLTWRMEVTEVIERRHVRAAVLDGFPADLNWFSTGQERKVYLLVEIGTGAYYLVAEPRAEDVRARLMDTGDPLQGLVGSGELFLELPLVEGKVFGEVEQITRQDGLYCWVVDGESKKDLSEIEGITDSEPIPEYILSYQTLADHTVINFVPGIGITRYQYHHHGSVAEVDLSLTEIKHSQE